MAGFGQNLINPENTQTNGGELQTENDQQVNENEFRLTEREKTLLRELFDWENRSNKTRWILGQPQGA